MRLLPLLLLVPALGAAERINHEGRVLGPVPVVTTPILFNTPAADAVVSSMQIMPRDSAWNEDISGHSVHANSLNIITRIKADLVAINPNRNTLKVFPEMNYVLVPDNQTWVDVRIRLPGQMPEEGYPADSDERKGGTPDLATVPYPTNLPVEPWQWGVMGVGNITWQADPGQGDRHSITVMPGTGKFWESWIARREGGTPDWVVSVVARFDIASNALRPLGWTSADAAGLPMFPALIRYDECERGVIEHALRIVVNKSRKEYIYPASHHASSITAANNPNFLNYPAMGQRVRLPSSFSIPAGWTKQSKAVAAALKKYGAMVADNGGFFSVSCCPDERFPSTCFNDVQTIDITNFEVIETTLEGGGPRAGTAPVCSAGPDQGVTLAAGATLNGTIPIAPVPSATVTTLWEVYAKPGGSTVTFGTPNALSTTTTFSALGTYTLRLKASDGTHTPAYDAVVISVSAGSNAVPTLTAISPTTVVQNSGAFTLTLTGSNFVPASQVTWSGRANLSAATASSNQLTVTVPAGYLATAGTPTITVFNPAPGGGTSSGQILTITAAAAPPSGGGSAAGGTSGGGGCGLGGAAAVMLLALGALRLRR